MAYPYPQDPTSRGVEAAARKVATIDPSEARMRLFLDTVRIANLLTEHSRRQTPFYWAFDSGQDDLRQDPPDPSQFRTDDGWIIQTYMGPRGLSVRCLICPWGTWHCFPDNLVFQEPELLPHLRLTAVPRKDLPYPRMPEGYLFVTHLDSRFVGKPAFVETERTEDWQRLLLEWSNLLECHGVHLNVR